MWTLQSFGIRTGELFGRGDAAETSREIPRIRNAEKPCDFIVVPGKESWKGSSRFYLLEGFQRFVERRALGRDEPRLCDEINYFFGVRLVDEVRGGMNVLFEQRPAKIVRSEMQRDLAGLLSFGEP